jgi:hypothetical protein
MKPIEKYPIIRDDVFLSASKSEKHGHVHVWIERIDPASGKSEPRYSIDCDKNAIAVNNWLQKVSKLDMDIFAYLPTIKIVSTPGLFSRAFSILLFRIMLRVDFSFLDDYLDWLASLQDRDEPLPEHVWYNLFENITRVLTVDQKNHELLLYHEHAFRKYYLHDDTNDIYKIKSFDTLLSRILDLDPPKFVLDRIPTRAFKSIDSSTTREKLEKFLIEDIPVVANEKEFLRDFSKTCKFPLLPANLEFQDGHVITLSLPGENLSTLPGSITRLERLRTLNLNHNPHLALTASQEEWIRNQGITVNQPKYRI